MISEIAFVNGVMAMWQQSSQQSDCCSAEGPSLYSLHQFDSVISEYNGNIVIHAEWGNRDDLNDGFHA